MSTETNQEAVVTPEVNEEGTAVETNEEVDALKAEATKKDETIGSLKRELKDAKKAAKETAKEETSNKKETTGDSELSQRLDTQSLRIEGIKEEDEIELAIKLKEETGKDMDELLKSKYFTTELEALRETKSNAEASSNIKGGGTGDNKAVNTAEYWIKKGTPPTREQVPDRKTRAAIARGMMANEKDSKQFYSD